MSIKNACSFRDKTRNIYVNYVLWVVISFCLGMTSYNIYILSSKTETLTQNMHVTANRYAGEIQQRRVILSTVMKYMVNWLNNEDLTFYEEQLILMDRSINAFVSSKIFTKSSSDVNVTAPLTTLHLQLKSLEREILNAAKNGNKSLGFRLLEGDNYQKMHKEFMQQVDILVELINAHSNNTHSRFLLILSISIAIAFVLCGILLHSQLQNVLYKTSQDSYNKDDKSIKYHPLTTSDVETSQISFAQQ